MQLQRVSGYSRILAIDSAVSEINDLYKKGSQEKKNYDMWLDKQLQFLDTSDLPDLIMRKRVFEDLGTKVHTHQGDYKLYSIRRQHHEGNPRVLFTYKQDDSGHLYILLVAFRETHRATSDYDKAIAVASERLKTVFA